MTSGRPDDRVIDVLVVEDNPGDARLLRAHLSDAALLEGQVDHVRSLEDALSRLRAGARRTDVVLLDLGLPDAVGLEAVETAEQLRLLRDLGVDAAQGFHLARPMPLEELRGWEVGRS